MRSERLPAALDSSMSCIFYHWPKKWAYQPGVTLDFSRSGKPTDAFIESSNGKLRAECLNAHRLMSLEDARRKCEAWRRDYNEERPHSAIDNKVPIELVNRSAALGPP